MHKRSIWLLAAVLLAGALVGCQAATPTQVASQPTPKPATATTAPTATAVPATATATQAPTTKPEATPTPQDEATRAPGTRADPTPAPVWQIPGIRSGEWGKGNPDAKMVLVEYSDFQ